MDKATLDAYISFMADPKRRAFVEERMGEWQVGDRGLYLEQNIIGFFHCRYEYSRGLVEFVSGEKGFFRVAPDEVIRLPLPIDPNNEERGLWGMVDWSRFSVSSNGKTLWLYDNAIQPWAPLGVYLPPTIALLNALKEQIR